MDIKRKGFWSRQQSAFFDGGDFIRTRQSIEQIVQITGHKNVNSLIYSVISDKKQQQISAILSGTTEGNENSLAFPIDEVTATACKIIFASLL